MVFSLREFTSEICNVSSEALEYYRKKCTEGLVKTLRDIANSPYSPESDVAGVTDPFLHIRLLKVLRVLGQGDADASDCMNDILAQVASKTESDKNAGNAILYEYVQTIMSIEENGGLRVLAIQYLGKFLSNRDNNIRKNIKNAEFLQQGEGLKGDKKVKTKDQTAITDVACDDKGVLLKRERSLLEKDTEEGDCTHKDLADFEAGDNLLHKG